jgi:hypothetical protein
VEHGQDRTEKKQEAQIPGGNERIDTHQETKVWFKQWMMAAQVRLAVCAGGLKPVEQAGFMLQMGAIAAYATVSVTRIHCHNTTILVGYSYRPPPSFSPGNNKLFDVHFIPIPDFYIIISGMKARQTELRFGAFGFNLLY